MYLSELYGCCAAGILSDFGGGHGDEDDLDPDDRGVTAAEINKQMRGLYGKYYKYFLAVTAHDQKQAAKSLKSARFKVLATFRGNRGKLTLWGKKQGR